MNELNKPAPKPAGKRMLSSQIPLSEEQEMIRIISRFETTSADQTT